MHMGHDVSGITSLGNNTYFFLPVGQIIGQVDSAVAVPDQLLIPLRAFLRKQAHSSWAWFLCGNLMTISTLPSSNSRFDISLILSIYPNMLSYLISCFFKIFIRSQGLYGRRNILDHIDKLGRFGGGDPGKTEAGPVQFPCVP